MKRLNYFGARTSFKEFLESEFHGLIKSAQLEITAGSIEDLDDYTFRKSSDASVIILDISPLDAELAPKICPSLLMLKEEDQLGETKVILTMGKEPSLELKALFNSCGVYSYFVWGGDEKLFMRTILEFLEQGTFDTGEFATLHGIDTPLIAQFPATYNTISSKLAIIESSIDLIKDEKFPISGGLNNELGLKKITVSEKLPSKGHLYYPNVFEVIPPIINSSGQMTKNDLYGEKISKEHFDNVLKTHGKEFIQKINTIGVFGPDRQMKRITKLLDLESCSTVHWYGGFQSSPKQFLEDQPDLIFLNIFDPAELESKEGEGEEKSALQKEDESKGFKFEEIPGLINMVKKQPMYEPIIIILNSPSHSLALRQVFQYKKLMAFEESMARDVLLGLIDKYNDNFAAPIHLSTPQFAKVDSTHRVFWMEKEIVLHQLNEDYVIFFYKGEIAPYTWLHIHRPMELTLMVTPEAINKNHEPGYKAFKARIMGLQGMRESFLRVFINLAFNEPKESFINFEKLSKRVYKSLEEVEGHQSEKTHLTEASEELETENEIEHETEKKVS